MTLLWWHWIAFGLILAALEMVSGGFYVIFFGIAALLVGVLTLAGASGPPWTQVLLFSTLSVASLLLFRSPLLRWMNWDSAGRNVDTLVGETAVPFQEIEPGGIGRVELRGTMWSARNPGPDPVYAGQRCVVVRVDQLTVYVRPEGARA
jgi:membrane protein implicated in regulation of membrane protease activity